MIGPQSFLTYARFRWLKLSLLVLAASIAAYLSIVPPEGQSGSTPVGYALGILSALLMLWLLWFGVRKRRYGTGGAPLRIEGSWPCCHLHWQRRLWPAAPITSSTSG